MARQETELSDLKRSEFERIVAAQRQTIDELRKQLSLQTALVDALGGQLAAAVSASKVDRTTRLASLNLMEDAVQARLAEERENAARRAVEEELRHANRRKDEFLATLAHELRTPLSPIRNSLYILRLSDCDRTTVDQICVTMERQVNHMVRLIDDLMEVSRITRGCIELRKEVFDLTTVIHEAVDSCRPQFEEARHELTMSISAAPLFINGDRVRLTQVITNLLSNSIKYTNEGGQIWVAAAHEENFVRIVVGDTGIGVPQEMLEKIFELFIQLHTAPERSQGGLGIGLALVRSLIQMHGGSIEAKSHGLGHGTEIIIRLPLAITATGQAITSETTRPASVVFPGSILVVDDSSDSATSLGMLLRTLGAEVRVVNDGPSALQECEIRPPSIVVCDIGMPSMDGYEVARKIRLIPKCKDIVLIALTGWGQAVDQRRSREAGFDHHLVKPVELNTLSSILSSVVRQHHLQSADSDA